MPIKKNKAQSAKKNPVVKTSKKVKIDISEVETEEHTCWCCGKKYTKLKGNFIPTNHPLFGKNGYYPVCKTCTDKFFNEMVEFFTGSEERAVEYICMMYGLYFNESPLNASAKINSSSSRINSYSSRIQIVPWIGRSYLDTLKEKFADPTVNSSDNLDEINEYKLTPKMIKFWGAGYEQAVYPTLQGYYDELLKLCEGKPDVKKQKLMKNLCLLEYQMQINIQAGKDIGTLSNSYKSIFEAAELKADSTDTSNDSFGKWIMDIEKYSPAEYYRDKKRYHDFFGLVEYIERFMYRPLRNLIFGTKEPEKEYWINDDETTPTTAPLEQTGGENG